MLTRVAKVLVGLATVGLAIVIPSVAVAAPTSGADPAAWPETLPSISSPYGMTFSGDGTALYVARREAGIDRVAVNGTVTELVSSSSSFMGIAAEADGDLLVTVDSDPRIYRLSMADLLSNPSAYQGGQNWMNRASVVYEDPTRNYFYGLATTADGTIYYSTYNDRQINRLRGGVSTPLLAFSPTSYFTTFSVTAGGDLLAAQDDAKVIRIAAADLASGSVPASAAVEVEKDTTYRLGLAMFADGHTYYDNRLTKRSFVVASTAPTALSSTRTAGTLAVRWSDPADTGGSPVASYEAQVDSGGGWTPMQVADATATLADASADLAYRVRVRAVTAAGPGAWSDVLEVAAVPSPTSSSTATDAPTRPAAVPSAPASRPALAATGSDTALGSVAGTAALLAGLALVSVRAAHRRRRTRAS